MVLPRILHTAEQLPSSCVKKSYTSWLCWRSRSNESVRLTNVSLSNERDTVKSLRRNRTFVPTNTPRLALHVSPILQWTITLPLLPLRDRNLSLVSLSSLMLRRTSCEHMPVASSVVDSMLDTAATHPFAQAFLLVLVTRPSQSTQMPMASLLLRPPFPQRARSSPQPSRRSSLRMTMLSLPLHLQQHWVMEQTRVARIPWVVSPH